jgi:hypothetical protein
MLTDYKAGYERRVRQFADRLRPMRRRAHEEAKGPCFMIFDENCPDDGEGWHLRVAKEVPVTMAVGAEVGTRGEGYCLIEQPPIEPESREWDGDDSFGRFIQFSFQRRWFCIDMPNNVLPRGEAEEVMNCRDGFFYVQGMPKFELKGEDVEKWEPFRKIYLYGDEVSAVEDMAFIFFQVWNLPATSPLYVMSAAFGGGCK